VIYPPQHLGLSARILDSGGALVSEFVPGTGPRPGHFPLRNRIISGLSRAVIVIEAHLRSGSLITARMALEQGRSVLAVPGSPVSGRSSGCHALIKDGARLVETVGDVLDELGALRGALRPLSEAAGNAPCLNDLEPLLAPGEPYSLDDLCERTGRAAADLLAALGELEIGGRVRRERGGSYVRLDGSVKDSRE
jgi:DNA processing protein